MTEGNLDGYKLIEDAVIEHLLVKFEGYVTPESVVAGEIDKLFDEILGEGTRYGILLEFGGGGRPKRDGESFKGRIWEWIIIGVVMIKYVGDVKVIEDDLRVIIGILRKLFKKDHTLEGVSPKIDINRIDAPQVMNINEVPVYWLPFEISAWDKL